MRSLAASVLASVLFVAGCGSAPPPVPPPPPWPEVPIERQDETPRVVRRLVREAQEQAAKNREMAAELRDPRGRARAQLESDAIERELDGLAGRVDNTDSDNLDDVMRRLQLLDTRIDLLHERLRAATERTSLGAVLAD